MKSSRIFKLILFIVSFAMVVGCTPTPKSYPPPGKTAWVPEGCRFVPA